MDARTRAEVEEIEDLSLNAWPSWQMELYDGWILRYSRYYTHRTNSVEQVGSSTLPLDEKVAYCEGVYRRWGTPSVFKVAPTGDPALPGLLEARGYHEEHATTVMVRELGDVPLGFEADPAVPLTVEGRVGYAWMDGLFALKHLEDVELRAIVPSMYAAIPKDEVAVSVRMGGHVVATGLGILDRDYVGVYAIHVDEAHRRRHIASRVVSTILREGRRHGARRAYLQVVSANVGARSLYASLGFEALYDYRFLVRRLGTPGERRVTSDEAPGAVAGVVSR